MIFEVQSEKRFCDRWTNGRMDGQTTRTKTICLPKGGRHNYKILCAIVPEKHLSQISLCITLEWEMEKKEKEGKINLSFVFCPIIYLATLNVYTKFEDPGSHKSEEICNKICLERKKNGQMRGMIWSSILILFYTMQKVIPNICTKFQNPRHSSSWEIFDTNFPMYYIGVRDGKNEKWKKKA